MRNFPMQAALRTTFGALSIAIGVYGCGGGGGGRSNDPTPKSPETDTAKQSVDPPPAAAPNPPPAAAPNPPAATQPHPNSNGAQAQGPNNGTAQGKPSTQSTKPDAAPAATITFVSLAIPTPIPFPVRIGGSAITNYRVKFGPAETTDCATPDGYQPDAPVATTAELLLADADDLDIRVCAIGRTAAGDWQDLLMATTQTFHKNARGPDARVLTGLPSGRSNLTKFSVQIAGEGITQYRAKLATRVDECADATGYSPPAPQTAPYQIDTTGRSGLIVLCAMGCDSDNLCQKPGADLAASWTAVTQAPQSIVAISGLPAAGAKSKVRSWIASLSVQASSVKTKWGSTTTTDCGVDTGYSDAMPLADQWGLVSVDLSNLSAGSVTFCARACDEFNQCQTGDQSTSLHWIYDTTPPSTSLVVSQVPVAPTNANAFDIGFAETPPSGAPSDSESHIATIRFAIFGSPSCPAANSTNYSAAMPLTVNAPQTAVVYSVPVPSGVADGKVYLCAFGADVFGNAQKPAPVASWTRDTAAPSLHISGKTRTADQTVTLQVTGSGIQSYSYVDTSDESPIPAGSQAIGHSITFTEPANAPRLQNHKTCVSAQDAAGNEGHDCLAWEFDQSPPVLVSSAPRFPTLSNQTRWSLTFSAQAVGHDTTTIFHYKVGSGKSDDWCNDKQDYKLTAATLPTADLDLTHDPDGIETFCLYACDDLNNCSSPQKTTWDFATTPPAASDVTLLNVPLAMIGTQASTKFSVAVQTLQVGRYKFKVGLDTTTACSDISGYGPDLPTEVTSPYDLANTPDGLYRICVLVSDAAGNWMEPSHAVTATWMKSTNATLTAVTVPQYSGTHALIRVAGNNIHYNRYKVGHPAFLDCSLDTDYVGTIGNDFDFQTSFTASLTGISDGPVRICVRGCTTTAAASCQAASDALAKDWNKVTTPPKEKLVVTGAPAGLTADPAPVLHVSYPGADNYGVGYLYFVGKFAPNQCAQADNYFSSGKLTQDIVPIFLTDGKIQLCVIAVDAAGNRQPLEQAVSITWDLDTKGPQLASGGTIFNAATMNGRLNRSILAPNAPAFDLEAAPPFAPTYDQSRIKSVTYALLLDTGSPGCTDEGVVYKSAKPRSDDALLQDLSTAGRFQICVRIEDQLGHKVVQGWPLQVKLAVPAAAIVNQPLADAIVGFPRLLVSGSCVAHGSVAVTYMRADLDFLPNATDWNPESVKCSDDGKFSFVARLTKTSGPRHMVLVTADDFGNVGPAATIAVTYLPGKDLVLEDESPGTAFGAHIAAHGSAFVVVAPRAAHAQDSDQGVAYFYEHGSAGVTQVASLDVAINSNGAEDIAFIGDWFALAVNVGNSFQVKLYKHSATGWALAKELTVPGTTAANEAPIMAMTKDHLAIAGEYSAVSLFDRNDHDEWIASTVIPAVSNSELTFTEDGKSLAVSQILGYDSTPRNLNMYRYNGVTGAWEFNAPASNFPAPQARGTLTTAGDLLVVGYPNTTFPSAAGFTDILQPDPQIPGRYQVQQRLGDAAATAVAATSNNLAISNQTTDEVRSYTLQGDHAWQLTRRVAVGATGAHLGGGAAAGDGFVVVNANAVGWHGLVYVLEVAD